MTSNFKALLKDEQKRELLRKELLIHYKSGKTLAETSETAKITTTQVTRLFGFNKKEFDAAKVINREAREKKSYLEFITITQNLGRVPSEEEYKKMKDSMLVFYPSHKRKAILAGYAFVKEHEASYFSKSKDDLLNHLRALAKKLKHSPKVEEVIAAGKYKMVDFLFHFGKYSEAIAQAGLTPNKHIYTPSPSKIIDWEKEKKECLAELITYYSQLGYKPSVNDIHDLSNKPLRRFLVTLGSLDFDKLTLSEEHKIWWETFKAKHPNWRKRKEK